MKQSRPTVLIIVVLLCCLGITVAAVVIGGFLFVSRSTGGILLVTPTPAPTETRSPTPTETPTPTPTLTPAPLTLEASNFYMATDKAGMNKTDVFSPTDDFFVFFDVSDVEAGTNFQSRWYALDIEGVDPDEPFQIIDYAYEEDVTTIYFQMTSQDPWPAGSYKVEIYVGDVKIEEQTFRVQE